MRDLDHAGVRLPPKPRSRPGNYPTCQPGAPVWASMDRSGSGGGTTKMLDHDSRLPEAALTAPQSVVALVDAASPVERELIGHWLAEGGITQEFGTSAPVTQIDLDPTAVTDRLVGRGDDPLVVPVRVLWLPPERDGVRRTTFSDLITLTNPRKPHRFMQRRLLSKAPDRHLVLTGQPARLSELRANNPGSAGCPGRFRPGHRARGHRRPGTRRARGHRRPVQGAAAGGRGDPRLAGIPAAGSTASPRRPGCRPARCTAGPRRGCANSSRPSPAWYRTCSPRPCARCTPPPGRSTPTSPAWTDCAP